MKVSLHWLKKFLDLNYSPQEISDMLTTIGLEVEGFEEVQSHRGGLKGVMIGQVVECTKHPDADKLSITKVDLGQNNVQQIVCGAPNVASGQKVLVATVGSTLYPTSGESLQIKKAKIRGVESHGMICAADELGLGSDHSGIMVLPDDVEVGKPASSFIEVLEDVLFEVGLTPNRSDATCHAGVARDLYAYIKTNLDETVVFKEPASLGFRSESNSLAINVNLKRPDLCPRYTGLTISGVRVEESPAWLKNQLNIIGVKSINNIVDVTNYILHELGQPLHLFDADEIDGKTINVDTCEKGSKFKALDEKEITLNGSELMICNGNNEGMCIGGVYGGYDSGVKAKTTSVFLESAHFTASSIRKTSMGHNLRTDAAKVFEKGSDPNGCVLALKIAATMIVDIAGGSISSDIIDIYPTPIQEKEIFVKYDNINHLLGINISEDEVHRILNAMGMRIAPVDDSGFKVFVPTNKSDVTREVDVIEEILRIYGFNKVPISQKISSTVSYAVVPHKFKIINAFADYLSSIGFNEMMGVSLIDSKLCIDAMGFDPKDLVYINNTSNANLDVMRPSMLLSGLLAVQYNLSRQQSNLRLYEYGKTYKKLGEDFEEREQVTLFVTGQSNEPHWNNTKSEKYNFYDLKQIVDLALSKLGVRSMAVDDAVDGSFAYGIKYSNKDQLLVSFGEVHPSILKAVGIKQPVYAAQFDVLSLLDTFKNRNNYVKEISKYPAVKRDLALVLDKNISFKKIEKVIKETYPKFLTHVGLFDIYVNDELLGSNKKSYALNFTFENNNKTLTELDINEDMNRIIHFCMMDLSATIRSN